MAFALFEAAVAEQHRHIDIGAQHVVAALAGDQAHIHLRIGRVEAVQTRHQPIRGEGEIGGDLQHLMCCCALIALNPASIFCKPRVNLLEKDRADLGQFDAAVDAVEQSRAELFFQPFDLLADRPVAWCPVLPQRR
jgi:hypothetical protein